ncbi:MAG: hypothetical protein SFZ03_07875 [Candidatus Melainabacteria bacterium]|nr:hypothetical protein [Candidatus Melainabacteria bacterium]
MVVTGSFRSSRPLQEVSRLRVLSPLQMVLGGILLLIVLASMVLYGWRVSLESQVQAMVRETRKMNEENAGLTVQLHQLHSFESLAKLSQGLPHLHPAGPSDMIEIRLKATPTPAPMPQPARRQPLPPVYGY